MTRNMSKPEARHSASSIQVEERLTARHIDYRFEPNFGIESIVDAEGHQVRLIEHRAPAEMVTRYAQQMKAGAVFPAIVINEQGDLIDGNTRRRAAVKAGQSTVAAYICRDLTPIQARSLSVELNQANGLAMDEKELHEYVRSAVCEGHTLDTKACARITGVRPATLDRWKAQAQFEQRATRCGIRDVDVAALPEGVQAALNGIRLLPVLREATSLAIRARLSVPAVRTLVTNINGATSEAEALQVVTAERDARSADIRAIASGFAARRQVAHRSSMHVAALLRLRPDDLVDVTPERRADAIARLRDLRDHVDRALESAGARWGLDGGRVNVKPMPKLCLEGGSGG
jgi:hypothetical protein